MGCSASNFITIHQHKPSSNPSNSKINSNHIVSLTSTTYGSLLRHDFDVSVPDSVTLKISNAGNRSKPLWQHLSEGSSTVASSSSSYPKPTLKQNAKIVDSLISSPSHDDDDDGDDRGGEQYLSSGGDELIVLYYTSLRTIRKTYEDCCMVRAMLKGFRVRADERDTSMDRSYRNELEEVLNGKAVWLPQVFIGSRCLGGAEEMTRMKETGELAKVLEGFSGKDDGSTCPMCGDWRFVLCNFCSGSGKVYHKEEEELRKCGECNENGLIRCTNCLP